MNKLQTLFSLVFLILCTISYAQEGAVPDSKSKYAKAYKSQKNNTVNTPESNNQAKKKYRTANSVVVKPNYNKSVGEIKTYTTNSGSKLSAPTKLQPKEKIPKTKEEIQNEIKFIEKEILFLQSSSDVSKETKLEKLNKVLVKKKMILMEK